MVLVDGGGVLTMWWVGPGGTLGLFLPLEVLTNEKNVGYSIWFV